MCREDLIGELFVHSFKTCWNVKKWTRCCSVTSSGGSGVLASRYTSHFVVTPTSSAGVSYWISNPVVTPWWWVQVTKTSSPFLLYRKCGVEPPVLCAPQTLCSRHSLKMHEQLYQLGHESSPGYSRASCYLVSPSLCYQTSIFHVNRHAEAREADVAETQSYGSTSTPSLSECLTRCNYCPSPPPLVCLTWPAAWHPLTRGRPALTRPPH